MNFHESSRKVNTIDNANVQALLRNVGKRVGEESVEADLDEVVRNILRIADERAYSSQIDEAECEYPVSLLDDAPQIFTDPMVIQADLDRRFCEEVEFRRRSRIMRRERAIKRARRILVVSVAGIAASVMAAAIVGANLMAGPSSRIIAADQASIAPSSSPGQDETGGSDEFLTDRIQEGSEFSVSRSDVRGAGEAPNESRETLRVVESQGNWRVVSNADLEVESVLTGCNAEASISLSFEAAKNPQGTVQFTTDAVAQLGEKLSITTTPKSSVASRPDGKFRFTSSAHQGKLTVQVNGVESTCISPTSVRFGDFLVTNQ